MPKSANELTTIRDQQHVLQLDKQAEDNELDPESDTRIVFVTPEWNSKPEKIQKVQTLATAGKLSLLAIDEAHNYGLIFKIP